MKAPLVICFSNLFALLTALPAQTPHPGNPGFGSGQHNDTEEQGAGQTISTLTKGQITFKYMRISADTAVVRKCVQGMADEELARLGPTEILKTYGIEGSFLVDVLQQGNEIAILMLLRQNYYYLRLIQDYPTGNPPAGDWYVPDEPRFTALAWKPLAYGMFSPAELDASDFHHSIDALSRIALNGTDRIDLDFKEGKGNDATYTFTADGIKKDGNLFQELVFFRKQELESEFFASCTAMSDTELKNISLSSVTEAGSLDPEASAFLNSLHDTAKAQALRARIEQLFKSE